jgi:hypothetical protein
MLEVKLAFQRSKSALYDGIVPTVALATHARDRTELLERQAMSPSRVLDPAITVMQQPRQWVSRASRHLERVQRPCPPGASHGQEAQL